MIRSLDTARQTLSYEVIIRSNMVRWPDIFSIHAES
jgi:hypothetical protein